MNKPLTAILAGAAFGATFFAGDPPAIAYVIANTAIDASGQCLVVSLYDGSYRSLPRPDNPLNPSTLADFTIAAAYLGSAVISYQATSDPTQALQLFWDDGPADGSCYGLTQIQNLRFVQ
jgi:hypothetical protein